MPDQSYRKVDIDAFDEDQYVEEEEQLASGSAAVVDVKAIQSEVRSLIQKYPSTSHETYFDADMMLKKQLRSSSHISASKSSEVEK